MSSTSKEEGGHWVICRSIRKNGKVIYPKNGQLFRFWVKDKK